MRDDNRRDEGECVEIGVFEVIVAVDFPYKSLGTEGAGSCGLGGGRVCGGEGV